MSLPVSISIKGLKEVQTFLKNKNKKAEFHAKKALMKSAIFVQGEVKMSIAGRRAEHKSVDTGRYLNSVDITKPKKGQVRVFSGLPYAKKLEFGTDFKNSPRRHFTNTAKRTKKKVKEIFNTEEEKI